MSSHHQTKYGQYKSYSFRQWREVPKAARQRLHRRDMLQICQYGFVEAHPMIDHATGSYRGCLVVQVPEADAQAVRSPDVQNLIEFAAGHIASIVAK